MIFRARIISFELRYTVPVHSEVSISKVKIMKGDYTFWKMSKCDKNAIQKVDMINKYQMSD